MSKFRLILTFLLCLTLPVTGWASGIGAAVCNHHHDHHAASTTAQHTTAHALQASDETDRDHHDYCADGGAKGKPCKGQHCVCGCGMGTCSGSCLFVLTLQPSFLFAAADAVPAKQDQSYSVAYGTSPLRPPIS